MEHELATEITQEGPRKKTTPSVPPQTVPEHDTLHPVPQANEPLPSGCAQSNTSKK
jgi:hypothetical protein